MARDDRNPDYLNQVKTSQTEKGSVITDFEYGSIRFKNAKLISTKKELLYKAVSTLTDKVYFFNIIKVIDNSHEEYEVLSYVDSLETFVQNS